METSGIDATNQCHGGPAEERLPRWRGRFSARLCAARRDDGLATTETVILTAFLITIAAAGGLILYNAMTSQAGVLTEVDPTAVTSGGAPVN